MEDGTTVKRFVALVMMAVLFTMMFALPVLAQVVDGAAEAEEGTAVNVAVTVTFLALVVQYLIEWIRGRFGGLDGDLIRLVALLLGFGAAWTWDLDVAADFGFEGLPVILSYVVAAFVIAGLSGIFGSAKNALRSRDPLSSIPPPA